MRAFIIQPIRDVAACLEQVFSGDRARRNMVLMLLSIVVTWFIYVPIHELLHVAGCLVTGGEVTELQLDPKYGAALLARIFTFVVPADDYAGRLTGFDWKDSDFIYLSTDFAPFLLTVLIGVPLIKYCGHRPRPLLLGAAIVVGCAPFYQLPGDYFEMGSILTTRVATFFTGGGNPPAFAMVRSDDVFRLIGEILSGEYADQLSSAWAVTVAFGLILVSIVVAIVLALATYAAGSLFARILPGIAPKPAEANE